jgi:hypothetical protein
MILSCNLTAASKKSKGNQQKKGGAREIKEGVFIGL